jgi:predicted nucleic acid-binding protein
MSSSRRWIRHDRAAAAVTAMIDAGTELLLSLVNYAEILVRPAEDEQTLRAAIEALAALGVRLVAPTAAIAQDAARHRRLNVSLADGFAIATAQARGASVASFDLRVRRALPVAGVGLAAQIS